MKAIFLIIVLSCNLQNILTKFHSKTCLCDYKFKDKTGQFTACQVPDKTGKLWCYIEGVKYSKDNNSKDNDSPSK